MKAIEGKIVVLGAQGKVNISIQLVDSKMYNKDMRKDSIVSF